MRAFKGFNKDLTRILPVEVISMRRVRNFTQKEQSVVIQVFTLVSIRWIVLIIMIQLIAYTMR